jgi:pSer/pThr/pTyr-binding forkhead associated (FHA) protein
LSLEPATSLGRVAGNTIVIDDPHTSARHAELRFARGQWWLRELGSSNGTLLNDEPVRAVVGVRPGDVIQCGRVRFRLVPSFPVPRVDSSA